MVENTLSISTVKRLRENKKQDPGSKSGMTYTVIPSHHPHLIHFPTPTQPRYHRITMEEREKPREFVRIGELITKVTETKQTIETTQQSLTAEPQNPTRSHVVQLLSHARETLDEALELLTKTTSNPQPTLEQKPTPTFQPPQLPIAPSIIEEEIIRETYTPSKPKTATSHIGMFNGQEIMTKETTISISPQLATNAHIYPGDTVRASLTKTGAVFIEKL